MKMTVKIVRPGMNHSEVFDNVIHINGPDNKGRVLLTHLDGWNTAVRLRTDEAVVVSEEG